MDGDRYRHLFCFLSASEANALLHISFIFQDASLAVILRFFFQIKIQKISITIQKISITIQKISITTQKISIIFVKIQRISIIFITFEFLFFFSPTEVKSLEMNSIDSIRFNRFK